MFGSSDELARQRSEHYPQDQPVGHTRCATTSFVTTAPGDPGSAGVLGEYHLGPIVADSLADELPGTAPATALARTLAARPVLCDLIAASPVLISKLNGDEMRILVSQATGAQLRLGSALRPSLPLSDNQLGALTAAIHAFAGTGWAWTNPDSARPMITDFEATVLRLLDIFIAGLLSTG